MYVYRAFKCVPYLSFDGPAEVDRDGENRKRHVNGKPCVREM